MTTNSAAAAAPRVNVASTGVEVQPLAPPSIRPKVIPASAITVALAPARSTPPGPVDCRDSGTWRALTASTTRPIGTLIVKIHRHDAALMR